MNFVNLFFLEFLRNYKVPKIRIKQPYSISLPLSRSLSLSLPLFLSLPPSLFLSLSLSLTCQKEREREGKRERGRERERKLHAHASMYAQAECAGVPHRVLSLWRAQSVLHEKDSEKEGERVACTQAKSAGVQ
jgi:hypothetical protein